ncbi:suppressor of fused domain protein [Corynebacterium sp. NPDC060344]|uniref:suppressor of fused domain protein n=1 Tax=Corynebacterium sp. NPDC060344 TaxID=3347101 RepID=UPI003660613C
MTAIIDAVRAQLCGYFEESTPGEAKLTFLGADPLTVLRFGPDRDGCVTYATLGCSRSPMQDPSTLVMDPNEGPRAELVLPVAGGLDAVTRPLAMLAASPGVEGLVLQDGALLDFGQPLWADARFTGFVLVDSPVPDVTAGEHTVAMLQPVPATPNEFALARAKGVPELRAKWDEKGTVLADPHRASVV